MKIFSNIILSSSVFVLIVSMQSINAQNKSVKMTNPLLQKSKLQYQAPNFKIIKDQHFKPAFEYGLAVHDKEIKAIADNPVKATFQNTVLALETSGVDLKRATTVFYNLTGSNY